MPTCGYLCPKCEGTGFNKETLEDCDWCKVEVVKEYKIHAKPEIKVISDEEWIEKVHAQNCCSDIGNTND
jgi:acetyl-CoA carboxylase beta subunit